MNGKAKEKRISDDVVKKVEKFIAKTGYKPNSLARSLRTGKTHTIALMIEDIANPFFANIARLIEEKAYKSGYKIIYSSSDNDPSRSEEHTSELQSQSNLVCRLLLEKKKITLTQ